MKLLDIINKYINRIAFHTIHAFFYRFIFGQNTQLSKKLSQLVSSWEKHLKKGDIPVSKETWESQYRTEGWKFLEHLNECSRYSIIIGYITKLKPCGAIIDVGCGEGVLFKRFKPYGYSKYLGIEISQEALSKLTQYQDNNTIFIKADAETYEPAEDFDVIVFNEILYYFNDPIKAVNEYMPALKDDGIFIVSSYAASLRAISILKKLKTIYPLLDETRITHRASSKSWICSVFTPFHENK
jgi:SAM-dependent methyltransferase